MKLKTVLIIDDSKASQHLTKYAIEFFDPTIKVLQVYDGKEALELLATLETQPDLIFLDINMPAMNGHEFLDAFSQKGYKSSVVIMLTSSDQEKDKQRSMSFDCVKKYIIKPLEQAHLQEITESYADWSASLNTPSDDS
ncbi:response regulator [Hirschia baltica]|uniref:Response regulator receiver protein n=1 Tax=Hirschia baltica (strain ATCC 49814 / DSM 5838 / IFAM 1418) TaxID=582402 RepID=C6XS11_HIRBI|nr:response regulator [Hirschia baltica]ACT60852.1 response regulator receiver protein [Hirschia baltica ATCC 49814]